MKRVIAIDHGNRMMKTVNLAFPSSYLDDKNAPALGGRVLVFNDSTFHLTNDGMSIQTDKTENDRYFILTLFAIGMELEKDAEAMQRIRANGRIDVELLVGLPLEHFKVQQKRFEAYFLEHGSMISFTSNGTPINITITGATAYPQAYAAAFTAHEKLNGSRVVNIVDIGGYTVDCIQLNIKEGYAPNMSLYTSQYSGVHKLFSKINDIVKSTGKNEIPLDSIEGILRNDASVIQESSTQRLETVRSTAQSFAMSMINKIGDKGYDLDEDKMIFMGGGSILLRDQIIKCNKVKKPIFIDNIHANAQGYQILHQMKAKRLANNA